MIHDSKLSVFYLQYVKLLTFCKFEHKNTGQMNSKTLEIRNGYCMQRNRDLDTIDMALSIKKEFLGIGRHVFKAYNKTLLQTPATRLIFHLSTLGMN